MVTVFKKNIIIISSTGVGSATLIFSEFCVTVLCIEYWKCTFKRNQKNPFGLQRCIHSSSCCTICETYWIWGVSWITFESLANILLSFHYLDMWAWVYKDLLLKIRFSVVSLSFFSVWSVSQIIILILILIN